MKTNALSAPKGLLQFRLQYVEKRRGIQSDRTDKEEPRVHTEEYNQSICEDLFHMNNYLGLYSKYNKNFGIHTK